MMHNTHNNDIPHDVIIVNIYNYYVSTAVETGPATHEPTWRSVDDKSIARHCFFRQISAADGCSDTRRLDGSSRRAVQTFRVLRPLRTVRRSLTDEAAKTMVHSFVINRTDYCNSVLYGMTAVHMRPLQNVLNALREWCWRWIFNISPQLSAISSTDCLWNNVWSSSRHYLCTRSSVRQRHVPCRHVSTRVNECTRCHLRSAAHGNLVDLRCRSIGQQDTESEVFLRLLR